MDGYHYIVNWLIIGYGLTNHFQKVGAWIDLLMLAKHRDDKNSFFRKLIDGKRGSVYRGIIFCQQMGWDRKKVKRFLDALECDGMGLP